MACCAVCGKQPSVGNNVSHANNKTKRFWKPNIQRVRVIWQGRHCHLAVCTRCIRSGKIQKAV